MPAAAALICSCETRTAGSTHDQPRHRIVRVVFQNCEYASGPQDTKSFPRQRQPGRRRNVVINTDGCDEVEGSVAKRHFAGILLNSGLHTLTGAQHTGRGIAAGNLMEVVAQQRQQLALAAAYVEIAQPSCIDTPSPEVLANEITLPQMEELRPRPHEAVPNGVFEQIFIGA